MAKEFLKPIYRDVYGDTFDFASFDSRMEMQKLVYILQEAGVTIGDYDFTWYKYGPYSQGLQNDILVISTVNDIVVRYSDYAAKVIERVRSVFSGIDTSPYGRNSWVECIASLQYLKSNILHIGASDDELLDELIARKSHLNNRNKNREALRCLYYIMG